MSVFQFFSVSAFRQALCALPLAWLWFVLLNELRVEWTVNPQYSYGWAVPFLCLYLVWKKAERLKTEELNGHVSAFQHFSVSAFQNISVSVFQLLLVVLALLYAPTRLIQEANPGWRLVSWALALEVVGITLCSLRLADACGKPENLKTEKLKGGRFQVSRFSVSAFQRLSISHFVFPLCFFLVAVPWPTWLEQTLIQGLTRVDTHVAVELLGWLGIPAIPHGNVIEIAAGPVGIDEACSGIRSFQATLMISLFLGELYSLGVWRRVLCVLAGFALSFVFNLARMTLLVWVAATKGVSAIASWHDPAGVTILLGCFFGLWGLGVLLKKTETLKTEAAGRNTENRNQKAETGNERSDKRLSHFSLSAFQLSAFLCLTLWLVLTEISVEAWYRAHEARLPHAVQWTMAWPESNSSLKELELSGRTREILRYDEGRSVAWEENGNVWQAVFLRWDPGRTALRLAQGHTPEVCMTAAGHSLKVLSPLQWFEVSGAPDSQSAKAAAGERDDSSRTGVRRSEAGGTNLLRLPFAVYEIRDSDRPFYVFYCLWNDQASAQAFETMDLTRGVRLAAVLAGSRNPGQRSLEIAVSGPDNAAEAERAVRKELEKIIQSN